MSTNKNPARKLTRAERKQIDAAIARAKRQDKRKKSAQDSIPFQRMYPDGVCRVTDNYYTKTVQFQDINYQLNQNEDKTAIFDGWCDFLNYFDSSIRFQLSFINLSATRDTYARRIAIPLAGSLMISAKVPCFNHPEKATLPLRWLYQLPYAQACGAP